MLESDTPSKTFLGVRFCLYGFDPVNEHNVRVKLINGGGVGVGQYSQSCTHVIVDKIVYDDPVCVAARNDGKTVVTGLWVDHSFDIGMPVDATSIMYRPLRDLNGIPGAKSLIICLTGYQRQDRDDIMTMVGLMGAQFSKPLVASKVTHLICYKFEGEKYELAKKIKKIKLINHRWLEDCLRDWELLSEANYSKSGYELEVMEAEAKDSDEEAEETTLKHSGQRSLNRSPHGLKAGMISSGELLSTVEVSTSTIPRYSPNTKEVLVMPGKSHLGTSFDDVNDPELNSFQNSGLRNGSSIKLAQPGNRGSKTTNMDNNLASTSKSPSLSNDLFTAISYSRKTPRNATPPNLSGEVSGNISGSPQAMKIQDVSGISSSKIQQPEERICASFVRSPRKGSDLCHGEDSAGILPQKRALELSGSRSKSRKMSYNAKGSIKGSAFDTVQLEPTSSVGDQLQINDYPVNETGYPNVLDSSCAGYVTTKLSTDLFSSKSVTPDDRQNVRDEKSPNMSPKGYRGFTLAGKLDMQNENAYEKSPQMSFKGLRESTSASRSSIGDYGLERLQVVGEPGELLNKQQDVQVPSLDRKLGKDNSHSPSKLDVLEGGNDESVTKSVSNKQQDVQVPSLDGKLGEDYVDIPSNLDVVEGGHGKSVTKPISKKKLAKKTLGSRPKLSNIANRKGSIYSSKIASDNHSTISMDGDNERATHKGASELETCPPTINLDTAKDVEKVTKCPMDDETQAPDEEDDNGSKKVTGVEKSELVEVMHKADMLVETEHVRHDPKVAVHASPVASENGTNETDPEGAVGSKNSEFGEPTLKSGGLRKTNKRKKQLSGKARMKAVPSNSKNDLAGENTSVEKNVDDKDNEKENFMPHPDDKPSSANASSKVEISGAAGKGDTVGLKEIARKSVGKPNNKTLKTKEKSQKVDSNMQPVQKVFKRVKIEPTCFILSGYRQQRKEFQLVIKRLKGKFCRDSHQWSYQATHFIAPDPIRRTEKFFAAAASGRWILKPEFLSACNEAGKFLAEEPYEWHKNGLSEDGAINLEAPRKWRQLKERTGHGAFYGMRIIVYGECIAPPLDTLKRVVKAGDGDILATCPPYTRFLKSGVDFAVVSPGMPRVDIWVQEFLKHEVPCVVADYLVEYVCKPGYSLEKHVLYDTHEWAEISFTNLTTRAEEIVDDLTHESPGSSESNDIACQVCGSGDREDVMLICGNESGSVGCGIGIHIDCCDPPLDNVPEEDWFCPKCNKSSINNTSSKRRKKGT